MQILFLVYYYINNRLKQIKLTNTTNNLESDCMVETGSYRQTLHVTSCVTPLKNWWMVSITKSMLASLWQTFLWTVAHWLPVRLQYNLFRILALPVVTEPCPQYEWSTSWECMQIICKYTVQNKTTRSKQFMH